MNATDTNMVDETKLPCADKLVFETRRAAETTATTSHYWYGSRPHAYRCRFCTHWHLSTKNA
ncbi:hypothetical protein JNM87_04120 [Candidatus Saccharibacteria bacterium]|nr:hypothetical protein [Candidatus Saccharibacteria bacterium]